ncbi:TPA: FimD/PapC N-terminal domain-containing protein [Escherichia coli]
MHQVLILPRFARLTFALGLATAVFPVDAEYYFNPRFLSNDLAESVDLSAFTKGREAPPGTYRVDIYLFPLVIGCVQTVSRHFVIQTPVTVCQTI